MPREIYAGHVIHTSKVGHQWSASVDFVREDQAQTKAWMSSRGSRALDAAKAFIGANSDAMTAVGARHE